jgi:hypothetical protein
MATAPPSQASACSTWTPTAPTANLAQHLEAQARGRVTYGAPGSRAPAFDGGRSAPNRGGTERQLGARGPCLRVSCGCEKHHAGAGGGCVGRAGRGRGDTPAAERERRARCLHLLLPSRRRLRCAPRGGARGAGAQRLDRHGRHRARHGVAQGTRHPRSRRPTRSSSCSARTRSPRPSVASSSIAPSRSASGSWSSSTGQCRGRRPSSPTSSGFPARPATSSRPRPRSAARSLGPRPGAGAH